MENLKLQHKLKDIAIFGASGFGRHVLTVIKRINDVELLYNIVGFYDDGMTKGSIVNGYPVLGGIEELNAVERPLCIALALGWSEVRKRVWKKIENSNIEFPTLIDPSVIRGNSEYIEIGEGSIICEGAILTTNDTIGKFASINMATVFGHDVKMGDFVSTMPSVTICGETEIADGVFLGAGTTVMNQVSIGENTIVGAGACVIKNLPANCTAVGVPARVVRKS